MGEEERMIDVKNLLRLILTTDFTDRQIASMHRCSHNTAARYRQRLEEEGLAWEQISKLDENELDVRLNDGRTRRKQRFVEPDWAIVRADLHRPSVTLRDLYEEYARNAGTGLMSETEFRRRYKAYARTLGLVMRQVHIPGHELFVDFSGKRPHIANAITGEQTPAELFVGVMGASRKTFALAVPSQRLPDWIEAHDHMMHFYGAAPMLLVPDNLKSAVVSISRKDGALINPTYSRFAEHYKSIVLPTRPKRPKDKAPVELAVKLVQRFVLGKLRNRVFYSLSELNKAIAEQMDDLNTRPMKKLGGKTRNQLFEELDRPAMRSLPVARYEYADWKVGIVVGADYHVVWEDGYYSVPFRLVGAKVDIKATAKAITVYHRHQAVATHPKIFKPGDSSTLREHQLPAHRSYSQEQRAELLAWADSAGPEIASFIQRHFEHHRQPQASMQALRGLQSLARDVGTIRLNTACGRALRMNATSIMSVRSMLRRGIEGKPIEGDVLDPIEPSGHENVRGEGYYH
ncbi:MAG: IS21 family transposase [Nevskiaceae bacterium]|nr:MAG: IS21 family transposase [Nevskiaceae bacterium]